MNQATRAGEKPFTKTKKNKKEISLPLNTVLLSAFKDFMLMVSCFSRNKRMQDVALDKTPCMASPKEEKMDRFELDELAMKAKKEKSNLIRKTEMRPKKQKRLPLQNKTNHN